MTFLDLAKKVLEENSKPMSALEIWNYAVSKGYDSKLDSNGKTPRDTLTSRLYTSANDPENSNFASIGSRPKRFYLPGITPQERIKEEEPDQIEIEETEKRSQFKEKDLHPLLAYFIRNALDCYPKTINHSTSKKKQFAEWLHPDMVACYYPYTHWESDVYEVSKIIGEAQVGLLSFEIKISLSFQNLRESFFQAVSNSSWAHEGYLVAARIREDPEFHDELKRLSQSFGIGIIHLDTEDPDNSKILYPAEEKDYIDWETVDKLTINSDFKEFLSRVSKDAASKEIRTEWYDKIPDREELIKKYKGS